MDYGIYVFGGGEILWKVFNGIALLFHSSNPYFTNVGMVTMGISLLYVAVKAIPQASLPLFLRSWFLPTLVLVALFYGPKASVHIIDKVDTNFQYSKVDNIPIGIAAVASLSTAFSEYLTDSIETVFTSSDAERFSKVGPMFGAKLIHAAHSLTIRDPIIKENLKDFTRQCFAWPYIFSNLSPGKQAALASEDMLGFIEANAHPLLGIYWRESNGQATFVNCHECAVKVREIIPIEINSGFAALAGKVFNSHSDPEKATYRLRQYFGDAWQSIAKGSSDAANLIQQELMLNSYRGGLMDKRDELGLGRYSGELIHINTERGQAQQDTSFLVKAALSGGQVPTIHTIIFALALMYFAIIAPMTFLPGGMAMVMTWFKVMIWLASWPVLFTVLNCLGHLFAAASMNTQMIGYGDGLNLMTQNGLADSAFTAYCWVMGLQYSIPFISWALLSGGGYAFSQLSSSFTQSGESFAAKAGSEMVDGNVSFDSQSLHTRSVANTQMAQQQLGSNFNYGARFDDGKIASLYGPDGQATFQEHQTQLATNVSTNDAASAMFGVQSQMALSSAHNNQRLAGMQAQQGTNELFSFASNMSRTMGSTESFGSTESINAQKSINNAMDIIKQFSKDHNISEEKAFNLALSAGAKTSGGIVGGLGSMLDAGANAGMSSSGRNSELMTELQRTGKSEQFANNLNEGLQHMVDNKGSITDSHQRNSLDQMQEHFNKSKSYSEQASINLQESQMLSRTASMNEQRGVSSGSNINDEVLSRVAEKHFGGDRSAAASWQARNPSAYQAEAQSFLEDRKAGLNTFAQSKGYQSDQDVRQNFEANKSRINNDVNNQQLDSLRQMYDVGFTEDSLNNRINAQKENSIDVITEQSARIDPSKIQDINKSLEEQFKDKDSEYLIKKAGRKMWNG